MGGVKRAVKAVKNRRVPGCDNIPPEAWKEGGLVSAKIFRSLLNKTWNVDDIPQDWKLSPLINLPKKGDLILCMNWRGMALPARHSVRSYFRG